ncbi:transposase, partial [Thiomicrospira microaerophila]|uniref:transposase n=1 Tax=Thiomicrospira microaerophila TaxID=406020 RepID=UPI0005CAC2A5
RQADYRQRIPIEGKFGQAKQYYGLNRVPTKRANTSVAWINSIFLVMNLLVLLKAFFWRYFYQNSGLFSPYRLFMASIASKNTELRHH